MRRLVGVVLMLGFLCSAVWSGVAAASPRPLPLSARLLKPGEFAGFTLDRPMSYRSMRALIAASPGLSPAQARAEIAQAKREGFKEVTYEWLIDAQGLRSGLSSVAQYGSAALAKAGLATTVHFATILGQTRERLRVRTVPGAVGLSASNFNAHSENILFTDGPFVFAVGDKWIGSARNPRRAALLNAAAKLYTRVHGHPAE